jgi:hypothetical protein
VEQYSIDGRGRGEVYITLALVSIGLGYLGDHFTHRLPFEVPWWIEVPSFAVWFGLVNVTFDRWLWRVRIFGRTLSGLPDFSGYWHGTIDAIDHLERHSTIACDARIRQTWSQIDVWGKTQHGITRSKIAGVRIDDEELRYEYQTEANVFSEEARHHVGFAVLRRETDDALEGYYYTLEGNTTKGTLHFVRDTAERSADRFDVSAEASRESAESGRVSTSR